MYTNSYYPPKESKGYLVLFLLFASGLAWAILTFLRPVVIESGCAEIAKNSSNIRPENSEDSFLFNFSSVKDHCLEDSYKHSK